MKKALGFLGLLLMFACSHGLEEKRLLVFYDAAQNNIENDINKLMSVAAGQDMKVDTSSNFGILKEDTLKFYSTVIFLDVSGEQLDYKQQTDLERYIQAGGGIIGVNTNIAPQYQWPWHNRMVAAMQKDHQNEVMVTQVSTQKKENEKFQEGAFTFDGGRIIFTSSLVDYPDDKLAELLNFSVKDNALNYQQAKSPRVPEDNRFTRIVLDDELNEPMELDVMPDGKVIYIQRRGEVKLYNPETKEVKLLATFDVNTEGNYEDGLLGVALDPKFQRNRRVYLYYSAPNPDSLNRLSRFYMSDDSLIMESEKVILEVPTQRETCCHTGGSIQFGPDGLLYLSTGDNTSSKESDGYTPIDERPGRSPYDAQKSSGNTKDLRGKIIRIKVNENGSYSIPSGNLFSKDGTVGRPEIYIMGARNPFRISIDWKTNWLYWGDVGPDVGEASIQGPQSYDEWNQARKPGNYGWPYFVADNKAYPDWDFTTNTPGPYFDPANPINESPYNYGSRELPPAQPALIWYPYGESDIWPNLGTGSRSAMAGPVYYADRYPNSEVKFPAYYNGKLFIYEWARSWIKVVTLDEQGKPVKIEPFMPDIEVSKPIDMEFGPDGAMYLLEYGANYFADNDEARLVKIEYAEGNRKPVAEMAVDQKAGAAPLTAKFSALGSYDYDQHDELSYAWKFTGDQVQSTEAEPSFTYEEPGVYTPVLEVTDAHGNTATAQIEIKVGNAPPVVEVAFKGNQSFFYDNKRLQYQINVKDPEDGSTRYGSIQDGSTQDGSTQNNQIDPTSVNVSFDFLRESKDLALIGNAAKVSPFLKGKNLIDGSDCRSCHDIEKTSIGPSYIQVAERYHDDPGAIDMLAEKIITGGSGNWGHSLMAAHPQHTEEETAEMVKYILSLANEDNQESSTIPLEGTFVLNKHNSADEQGTYYLSVHYTDQGANNMPPITTRKMVTLRHPKVQAEDYEGFRNVQRQRPNGGAFAFVSNIQDSSYIVFKQVDLTDITSLTYRLTASPAGGKIALHLDSPEGTQVSETTVAGSQERREFKEIKVPVTPTIGVHDLYFVFSHDEVKDQHLFNLDWIYFHTNQELTSR